MNLGGTVRLNRVGVCVICGVLLLTVVYLSPRGGGGGGGGGGSGAGGGQKVNLRHLLIASIEAAERGGREVVRVRTDPAAALDKRSKGKTAEGAESLVTAADYSSHCVMYYGVTNVFPSLKVISEEKNEEKECKTLTPLEMNPGGVPGLEELPDQEVDASKVSVWIDPLDATQEYTEKILDCVTTMVCVAYEGNPIIGVIHQPFGVEPKTTWVWINKGQSPHLKPKFPENETKTIVVSRSHSGNVVKMLKEAFGESTNVVKKGGAGYKVLAVIGGNASAYVHVTGIKKWDVCAGDAILTAVGGRMTTLKNQELDYSGWGEVNEEGLLATLRPGDHPLYLEKIANVRSRPPRLTT